jgi:hypothetical protein
MSGAAIGIICKAPRPGLSKTRLIPTLGPDKAAELSRAFLVDVATTIDGLDPDLGVKGYAVCSPAEAARELAMFLPASFAYAVHTDPNLGRVLDAATNDLFGRGHDCVLLVNGDSPTLPPAVLRHCILALRGHGDRVVFGPAVDGGYYLIGLKRREPRLFADIPWSTADVLDGSLARAAEIGLPVLTLPVWYDIDDRQSFGWLLSELDGVRPPGIDQTIAAGQARATRGVLAPESEVMRLA